MINNTPFSLASLTTLPLEIAKGLLFWTLFVVLGIVRIFRAVTGWFFDLFLRLSLAILAYSFIGIIVTVAILVIVGYYLIVLPGNQYRIS